MLNVVLLHLLPDIIDRFNLLLEQLQLLRHLALFLVKIDVNFIENLLFKLGDLPLESLCKQLNLASGRLFEV